MVIIRGKVKILLKNITTTKTNHMLKTPGIKSIFVMGHITSSIPRNLLALKRVQLISKP